MQPSFIPVDVFSVQALVHHQQFFPDTLPKEFSSETPSKSRKWKFFYIDHHFKGSFVREFKKYFWTKFIYSSITEISASVHVARGESQVGSDEGPKMVNPMCGNKNPYYVRLREPI